MNRVAYEAGVLGICACAGYLSAWFAAGPHSSLRDPRLGALVAVSMRITDVVVGRHLVHALYPSPREEPNWDAAFLKDTSSRFAMAATVTIIGMNCIGIPLSVADINVLTIGAAFGVPCSLALAATVIYLYND